ncbi:hypothetical protein RB195_026071 [Necator americanus]|uniref:Uncharacterized protein n=1 Tax=Necator americanus TaxID=51031 RepID=A0ABR1EV86_NECAM
MLCALLTFSGWPQARRKSADMKSGPDAVPGFMLLIATRTFEGRIRGGDLPVGMIGLDIGVDERKSTLRETNCQEGFLRVQVFLYWIEAKVT